MLDLLAPSPAAFIAVALLIGLVIGSFLNVVIYRLPIMLERQWQEQELEQAGDGTLPAPLFRKADEIIKLAKSVKGRMRPE